MTDPSWRPDPTGRHQLRYFDGSIWTDNVSDDGESSLDPRAGLSKRETKRLVALEKDEANKAAAAERAKARDEAKWRNSAGGQAAAAYAAGDLLFQWVAELQKNTMSALGMSPTVGGTGSENISEKRYDITHDLAAIESQGWRLHTSDHFFMQTAEMSRDKFLSSGQQTAIAGKIIGVYLFRRVGDLPRVLPEGISA